MLNRICRIGLAAFVGWGAGLMAAQGEEVGVVGVTVPFPSAALSPPQWSALREVDAQPEFLYLPRNASATDPGSPFDFGAPMEELDAYGVQGFRRVSLTVTPHLTNVPVLAQVDEAGTTWNQRQNPFDPAFVAEWGRLHREFVEGPMGDDRLERVYIAPPSYFGEIEYYMGEDWADLRLLAYGPEARDRFADWIAGRYRTPEALARGWGRAVAGWDAVSPPVPPADPQALLGNRANDWLDFMEWRVGYLTDLVSGQVRALASQTSKEVGIKVAWGDTSSRHGTDTAAILARCAGLGNLVLHHTNGHSAADLAYAGVLARRYGVSKLVTENDGNRYGRTEVAKVVVNAWLAGFDEYNYSYVAHLTDGASNPTDSHRALVSARRALSRARPSRPPRHPVAFLHSTTTRHFRAPEFFCKDVALVYDLLLSNERPYHWWGYSWARWLAMPDVTGEQPVLDGDLEGRRLVIVPNTSFTVLASPVRRLLDAWVEDGGTLVGFGGEAVAWELTAAGGGADRCRRVFDWAEPATEPAEGALRPTDAGEALLAERPWALPDRRGPVWRDPLPHPWEPVLVDAMGRAALARLRVGRGSVYLFAGTVPRLSEPDGQPYHRETVPLLLRAIAEDAGCPFAFQCHADEGNRRPVAPLAMKYLGLDPVDGAHVFCAGAYDRSVPAVRMQPAAGLAGTARLVLVDLPFAASSYAVGTGRPHTLSNVPPAGRTYIDPTNTEREAESSIPFVEIDFDAARELILDLEPRRPVG